MDSPSVLCCHLDLPSVAMLFDDSSVPNLPCLPHGSLPGSTSTCSLYYSFFFFQFPLVPSSPQLTTEPNQVFVKESIPWSYVSILDSSGKWIFLSSLRFWLFVWPSHLILSHFLWSHVHILSSPLLIFSFSLLRLFIPANILNIPRWWNQNKWKLNNQNQNCAKLC